MKNNSDTNLIERIPTAKETIKYFDKLEYNLKLYGKEDCPICGMNPSKVKNMIIKVLNNLTSKEK